RPSVWERTLRPEDESPEEITMDVACEKIEPQQLLTEELRNRLNEITLKQSFGLERFLASDDDIRFYTRLTVPVPGPPEEAEQAPSDEVAARSFQECIPLAGLLFSGFGGFTLGACTTRPQHTPSSHRPHKESGNASAAESLPDRLLHPSHPSPTTTGSLFSASQDSVYVIGSSIVIIMLERLPTAFKNRNAFGAVVIHVGTNDIYAWHTYKKGCEWFSRLFGLQSWLCGWCAVNGLGFMDNWSSFWEQPALYRRDGLHPSRLGSRILSRNIERAVR
ncbi:hypothetical protein NFI96_025907, partial [Prochilodus magdalenae]